MFMILLNTDGNDTCAKELAEQTLALLPPAEEYLSIGLALETHDQCLIMHLHNHVWAVLALEKHGQLEKALEYSEVCCMETDARKGASNLRWSRLIVRICRGRIYTALGDLDAAVTEFTAAEDIAAVSNLPFFAALAAREHGTHILRPAGKDAEADAKLDYALKSLVGVSKEQLMAINV